MRTFQIPTSTVLLATVVTAGARAETLGHAGQTTTLSFAEPPAATDEQPRTPRRPDESGGPAPPERANPDWTVQIEPLAWFVGPSGKFKLPVNSGTGPGSFTSEGDKIRVNDLELDDTRLRPAGTLTIARDRWRFSFTGAEYEVSHSNVVADFAGRVGSVAFAAGDTLAVDMTFGSYEASVGYRIWDYDFKQKMDHPEQATDAVITVHLLGGIRFYDVEIGVRGVSGAAGVAEGSHLWIEPILGARAEMVVAKDFSLILQMTGGVMPLDSTSSFSVDLQLAFQWRPIENVGVQIGWRQLAFDLSDGKNLDRFEYEGRLAGLFTGVVIRF